MAYRLPRIGTAPDGRHLKPAGAAARAVNARATEDSTSPIPKKQDHELSPFPDKPEQSGVLAWLGRRGWQ